MVFRTFLSGEMWTNRSPMKAFIPGSSRYVKNSAFWWVFLDEKVQNLHTHTHTWKIQVTWIFFGSKSRHEPPTLLGLEVPKISGKTSMHYFRRTNGSSWGILKELPFPKTNSNIALENGWLESDFPIFPFWVKHVKRPIPKNPDMS